MGGETLTILKFDENGGTQTPRPSYEWELFQKKNKRLSCRSFLYKVEFSLEEGEPERHAEPDRA